MCTSICQSRSKCFITPLSFHIFTEKSVCDYCVWYDEYLGRIYQKFKILALAHILASHSKSVLPQRASFSLAGTHLGKAFNLPLNLICLWIVGINYNKMEWISLDQLVTVKFCFPVDPIDVCNMAITHNLPVKCYVETDYLHVNWITLFESSTTIKVITMQILGPSSSLWKVCDPVTKELRNQFNCK